MSAPRLPQNVLDYLESETERLKTMTSAEILTELKSAAKPESAPPTADLRALVETWRWKSSTVINSYYNGVKEMCDELEAVIVKMEAGK